MIKMSLRRGDLGFLANSNSSREANRNFFGSPGHPAKKGVMSISQVSKLNGEESTGPVKAEFTADAIISKRTEWLESQERRMTATINETRSDTNHLNEKLTSIHNEINKVKEAQHETSSDLYNEIQTVFGHIPSKLIKIVPSMFAFDEYETTKKPILEECIIEDEWIMLVYPMKNVQVSENHIQSFMRWKRVDSQTGQLSFDWAVVYEQLNDDEKRPIQEFSLVPH